MSAPTNSNENEADDSDDDLPLAELIDEDRPLSELVQLWTDLKENGNILDDTCVNDFIKADDELVTSESLTDDDIINDICSSAGSDSDMTDNEVDRKKNEIQSIQFPH